MRFSHKGYIDINLTVEEESCLTKAQRILNTIWDTLDNHNIADDITIADILEKFSCERKLSFPIYEEQFIQEED